MNGMRNSLRVLAAMLKADFFERTRQTGFLVTVCAIIYLGYAVNAGQILIKLDTYRGVYNSAWVGSLMALVITFFLGIAGFYLVKNTVERDELTGVGQILATTPLTRAEYLLGKWLSSFAVLSALVGILAVAAVLMQVFQREVERVDVWALLAPLLFIALPMMALVAAFAVFFETVPFLKGGLGNIVYFFGFLMLFTAGIFLAQLPWLDVTGVSLVGSSMRAAAQAAFDGYSGGFVLSMASDPADQTFVWNGVTWTAGLIAQRVAWLAVSAALVLLGGLFFHRFDPNRRARKPWRARKPAAEETVVLEAGTARADVRLSPLAKTGRFRWNIARLAWLETLLLVKGQRWYWLAGIAILWIGCAAAPPDDTRRFWYMFAAVFPVLVWSKMGARDARCQTEQLIQQAAHPLARVLGASWLAGVFVTAAATSGVLVGRLIAGEPLALLPWALAVLFVPSLALALGVWSRSSKLFEVVYLILWYLGPFNKENGIAIIDYLGLHAGAPAHTAPLLFAACIAALVLAAWAGKRAQMMG